MLIAGSLCKALVRRQQQTIENPGTSVEKTNSNVKSAAQRSDHFITRWHGLPVRGCCISETLSTSRPLGCLTYSREFDRLGQPQALHLFEDHPFVPDEHQHAGVEGEGPLGQRVERTFIQPHGCREVGLHGLKGDAPTPWITSVRTVCVALPPQRP
jgi:hypothetical protein